MIDRRELEQSVAEQTAGHVELVRRLGESWTSTLAGIVEAIVACLRGGGKLLLAGNGGSAADAQHVAAEFVGRFRRERVALAAIALSTDTSALTAIGNDYGFERVFSRQVEALARAGDLVWLFSTSGNSPNVLEAAAVARKHGARVVAFAGGDGGALATLADLALVVPERLTARVQEGHMLAYHIVCDLVEAAMIGEGRGT